MKTVITCINSKFIHSSLAPWYLLAGIRSYATVPQQAVVREFTVNQVVADVVDALAEEKADVYAFCTYIWNIRYIEEILPLLRAAVPNCTVILGGPEVSFRPKDALKKTGADYICIGEGEESLPALLDALAARTTPVQVAGVCGRDTYEAPQPLKNLPSNPFLPEYFETLNGRIAYVEGSRGCPFSCAFCLSGREDALRLFPLERVKEDVLRLAQSGAKTVKFVDRTFNSHKERCNAIIRFIIAEYGVHIPKDVCFHFEVAADLFDQETLSLLATAPKGLFQMEAGLQSFHLPTLSAVTRKTSLDTLCRNVRTILDGGNIHLHVDLIAGLPYEDFATFRNSFNMAYDLQPHMLQLGFLKLLHGSRLRAESEQNGYRFSEQAPYEVYASNWMTKAEFETLHEIEDVVERLYNSGRFRRTLQYVLEVTEMTPFDLFADFAAYLKDVQTEKIPLDSYIGYVLAYFSELPQTDVRKLRDMMTLDCLTSRQIHHLPLCLYRKDKRVAKITRQLAQNGKKGIKRGVAVLEAKEDTVAIVEYTHRDRVTNSYTLQLVPLTDFDI